MEQGCRIRSTPGRRKRMGNGVDGRQRAERNLELREIKPGREVEARINRST